MKRLVLVLAGLGATAAVGVAALALGVGGRAEASTFHVNFDTGRDQQDGLTPATAWKHAPGDPNATGAPARARLQPGDVIVFAPNVPYRGSMVVSSSGEAGKPITFTGATPRAAVIDGSDPLTVAPCRSAEDCGGAPAWQSLVRAELPAVADATLALFSDAGLMRPAQEPDPADDFYRDEVDDMLDADGQAMSAGRVALPRELAAQMAAGGGRLALWVKPNRVAYRAITGMDGTTALFDPTDLKFYADRTAKAAVIEHVALLDRPGEYAVLPGGRAVVAMLPQGAKALSWGAGRGGFQIRGGASHLVIRGLAFENMSDGGKLAPGGVAVFSDKGSSDITIQDNTFRNFIMVRGQGPIIQRDVADVRIVGNSFDTIVQGSGMRLTGARMRIEDNEMRRLGRTGIMLLGVSGARISGNRITDIRGVHGNGMSIYLDNRDIEVVGNTVTDAKQPVTFHGDRGKGTADNNILFANNLFVATPDALGSLISWGAYTRGVMIRNNVVLGGRTGLRLHSTDTGVTVVDNVASGLIVGGKPEAATGWQVTGNEWTALTFQQKRAGQKASLSGSDIASSLQRGVVPPNVCSVITRHSLPGAAAGPAPERAVGAQLRCP